MSQTMNETFEVEALNKLLESLESKNIDMVKKKYIAEKLLPTLFDALPKLLRAVERNNSELEGIKSHWRYDKTMVEPIKPNQWLAQYLHRHNPKYRDLKISDELLEKISKSPSIVQNNKQTELLADNSNNNNSNRSTIDKVEEKENNGFVVGQRVRARFAGKNHLYNGNIIADNGDGTYGIEYDDGDWEDELNGEFIQAI